MAASEKRLSSTGCKVIPGVTPAAGSTIRMLGSDKKLAWRQDGANVVIDELPAPLPCDYAWVFEIRRGGPRARHGEPPGGGAASGGKDRRRGLARRERPR